MNEQEKMKNDLWVLWPLKKNFKHMILHDYCLFTVYLINDFILLTVFWVFYEKFNLIYSLTTQDDKK